jgi:hypothetical protein
MIADGAGGYSFEERAKTDLSNVTDADVANKAVAGGAASQADLQTVYPGDCKSGAETMAYFLALS